MSSAPTEEQLEATKCRTASLASQARREMAELNELFGKLESGTATLDEKDKIKSLNKKLSVMKHELAKSATVERDMELSKLRRETRSKTRNVLISMRKKEIRSVVRSVCAAESVDLAFVIDATHSMSPYIDAVKENTRKIVSDIRRTNGNLSIHVGVVVFRDIGYPKRFEILDFTTSIDDFETFLGAIVAKANPGNDTPEDFAGGIQECNKLTWSQSTRVVFAITDAPCHGKEFHNCEYPDNYPNGTPGIDVLRELRILSENHGEGTMTLYFGQITSDTDEMLAMFKKNCINIEVTDFRDTKTIHGTVTKSVRRSIFKTVTVATHGKKSVSLAAVPVTGKDLVTGTRSNSRCSLKSYSLVKQAPSIDEWKARPAVTVVVYRNRPIKSMNDLQEPIAVGVLSFVFPGDKTQRTDKTSKRTMYFRCAPAPFAEGEIRLAYHGQLARLAKDLEQEQSAMVVKSFKHVGEGLNDRKQYLKQMEVSNIAHFLATQYNKSPFRPVHCGLIKVLQVCVLEEEDDTNEAKGNRRFCAEQPLPEGTFAKFSNNTGYWDSDTLDETLLRFSDFSFQATGNYLMVTDLQGVKHGNTFYLTDPAILCKDVLRFGNTNLGETMMLKCISGTRALIKENGWH